MTQSHAMLKKLAARKKLVFCFLLASCCLGISLTAEAAVTLPAIFSDHAVLQKARKVPVWGKAAANEKVTVTLNKATASTTAGENGKWKVEIDLSAEGQGPYELIVEGSNKLTIKDVVVGEVWVCSGQSNMSVSLYDAIGGLQEIAQCANPLLRQFAPSQNMAAPTLQEELPGRWVVASPASGPGFTAVGYFFGKKIQNELKVPVGLIKTSWGGTPSEAWTSAEALDSVPDLKAGKDKVVGEYQNFQDYLEKHKAWEEKYQRVIRPMPGNIDVYVKPDAPTADWKTITLPNRFSDVGLPEAGAVWLRKKVTLLPTGIKIPSGVICGEYRDNITVFWNGRKIGERDIATVGGGFYISGEYTTNSENILAIRITNSAAGMGILPGDKNFILENSGPLKGQWLAKVEYELPALEAEAKASLPVLPPFPSYEKSNIASFLFNGMINPFIPYRIAGVIWYQGEWNARRAFQYRTAFPLMISDWRKHWGQGDFPFYFCQLPGFNRFSTVPGESPWAELREAQNMTLSLPNTGQAVLIDIGEEGNIHPGNKKDAGERLALCALARTYDKQVVYSGPTYDSMMIEGNQIRIHFKNCDGGLVGKTLGATYIPTTVHPETTAPLIRNTPTSEVEGFAICGEDKKWVWANAKIQGSDIIVSAATVQKPIAVRYAWSNNPICNLYNGAGLPAGPFRTDTFNGITEKARY